MTAAAPSSPVDLRASGHARFIAFPHPFEMHTRIDGEIPSGWTISDVLRESKLANDTPSYAGILVRLNGKRIYPSCYSTTILRAGDSVVARAIPRDPITILITIGAAIAEFASGVAAGLGVGGAAGLGLGGGATLAGSFGAGIAFGGTAYGLGVGLGFAIGYGAVLAGGSYLLALAAKALIGSPSGHGDSSGQTKRVSPTASGAGNQLIPDHPVFIPVGEVRVRPPHVAIPFQPGVVGGQDQDPSIRELLGVAGDCILDQGKLGKTALELLDIEYTVFQNEQTVGFPTAAVKRPGIQIRDTYIRDHALDGANPYEIVTTDIECDELSLVWFLAGGLNRTNYHGTMLDWQISFDVQYRVAGTGGWTGFFATDANGNSARWRVPFVSSFQVFGTERFHLFGHTAEPFFFYWQRRVPRARYEVRFRIRQENFFFFPTGVLSRKEFNEEKYPKDRHATVNAQKGDTDSPAIASDPQLVQFAAFRDEPAVEGFTPGLSGVDLQLNDQTTKSDESSMVSFRARQQIPNLSGGSRTAATTTRNPVAIVLWLLTGPMPGDNPTADSKIDFQSFQAAFDYCAETVPTVNGGTEARHECDAVLDRSGVSREEQCQELLSNFRMRLFKMDGKYHIDIDRKRTAPVDLFSEAEILEFDSERSWAVIPDVLRVEFFNRDKMGDKDELAVFNDSPPVAGILEHGGYAAKTAEVGTSGTPVSVTCARSGDYATLTRASGSWTFAAMPEEGWVCIRFPGGSPFADARLFLIDGVSEDLLTITVIDKAAAITAGTRNARFNTTAANRVEALSLPYSQRASECFREARYRLAQRNRPEIYNVHVGTLDWLRVYQGAMFEASCAVCQFGKGSGRVLSIAGTTGACTGVQMDEEFDLTGISVPVIKFITSNGSQRFVTRYDIDPTDTATLRAGGDNRWLAFTDPQNVGAIGLEIGSTNSGNGSVGAFGEKFYETKELVVRAITMGRDLSGTLRCVDHAPEIFDAILDQAPVPRFNSGITEPGIGDRAKPAMPQISAAIDGVSTPMGTIDAAAPSGGNQVFTRVVNSFIDEGWTSAHKATIEGYANANNNKVRATLASAPTGTTLTVVAAMGGLESGTGDERVRGVIGCAPQTLTVRRSATGITKLDVTQTAGVVAVSGPVGEGAFSDFIGAGIVELSDMPAPENNGFFNVTGLLGGGDGIQLASATMVTSTGTGSERCHQANIRRSSGSWISTDWFAIGDRVAADGFEQDIDAAVFTVRAMTNLTLAVDDPFGLLVTETGSGDEMVTKVKVPLAYEIDQTISSGAIQLHVTVPIRPGTKGIVPTEEIEARYRLRDRATGRTTGGWIAEQAVPASAVSITFGPIPADSDFDVAFRAISREKKTASDWCVLTGNGPADRPPAPTHLQIHSDSIASEQGRRFALRAEWTAPDTASRNYLLRYQREADTAWAAIVVHDDTSCVIADAQIGTYEFELYTLGTNGQPSDVVTETFDWQPDREFEQTNVLNLRLVNHADEASQVGLDPLLEFTGPDILLAATEPDFTGEYTGEETADVNTGLDPLVRDFEIQVFDPETGTELRLEKGWTAREYRYTRAMNADDQIRAFGRWAQREVGFRWRMHSVTNRTSAWDVIAVANPKPAVPGSLTLTSTPGNSAQSLAAIVHADFAAGGSSDDSDVADYAVWASDTPGFTPGQSNFKGVSGRNGSRVSFPASSGVTIYVRGGRLDEFHPSPETITDPSGTVNLLSEQSVATIDGAVFPVDTDDIVPGAVTDMAFANGTVWPQTISVAAKGGPISIVGYGAGQVTSGSAAFFFLTANVKRRYLFDSVQFYDGSLYTNETVAAASLTGSADVSVPLDSNDRLFIGNTFPFGASDRPIIFDVVNTLTGSVTYALEYWNGTSWVEGGTISGFIGVGEKEGNIGSSLPGDWEPSIINGSQPYYWISVRLKTGTPTGTNPVCRSLRVEYIVTSAAVMAEHDDTRFLCHTIATVVANEPTKDIETFIATFSTTGNGGLEQCNIFAHAGKR